MVLLHHYAAALPGNAAFLVGPVGWKLAPASVQPRFCIGQEQPVGREALLEGWAALPAHARLLGALRLCHPGERGHGIGGGRVRGARGELGPAVVGPWVTRDAHLERVQPVASRRWHPLATRGRPSGDGSVSLWGTTGLDPSAQEGNNGHPREGHPALLPSRSPRARFLSGRRCSLGQYRSTRWSNRRQNGHGRSG